MADNIEPGSIVVAFDGSEHAERAARWAAEQAALEGRQLVVVSIAGFDEVRAMGWAGMVESRPDAVLDGARIVAADGVTLAERLRPGLRVRPLPAVGDPRTVLLDLSADAHLIVMGSQGRGALRSMLLGSVSATVSKHAQCPVIVCRPQGRAASSRGVVVGADATPESLPVIQFAFQQASLRGLPLTVLHCFWDVEAAVAAYRGMSSADLDQPDLQELWLALSESVAGMREKYPDVPISLELKHGLVDEALSPRGRDWELVVVGRHPLNSIGRLLTGAISTAVLERAHSTVAVVPEASSE